MMADSIELTGIAWDHSRAFPPLVATAQRFEELHPGVRIRWTKRSLHEFGHMPIDQLADRFDLIVIDHPWAGFCFARDLILDCRQLLKSGEFEHLSTQFIGNSFTSYLYDGKLQAIPIDAATPAPSWRPDLLKAHHEEPPRTWTDLIRLADRKLLVMPGFPADLFLNWTMLLEALGGQPCTNPEAIADPAIAIEAMDLLKRLAEKMPRKIDEANPIRIAEWMTRTDEIAACAFAYSYSNYCRPSFTSNPLRYGPLPALDNGTPLHSIIGGTGIAISSRCQHPETAMEFARFCASSAIQCGIYAHAGGQPAHRDAWDPTREDHSFTGGFFTDSRIPHQEAIIRPRYNGYVPLQENAGVPLQQYLRGETTSQATLDTINHHYRQSRTADN